MSRQPTQECFTYLPLLNTEEMIEGIGKNWERPSPESSRNGEKQMDDIILQWLSFCGKASQGRKIGMDTIQKGEISMDLESINAYLDFHHAMGKEKYPEIIVTIQSAFAMLLSNEGKKVVAEKIPPIKVNRDLRNKINKLVKNLGPITDGHASSERRKWHLLDLD